MVLLKDSPNKKIIRKQYDQLWIDFLNTDEDKVKKIIKNSNNKLRTKSEQLKTLLQPFNTHLTWIIPLCALVVAVLLYIIFIWVALLVE